MKRELNLLYNALMFYTRIPVPHSIHVTDKTLSEAFRYFPLIGALVGGVGAATFMVATYEGVS